MAIRYFFIIAVIVAALLLCVGCNPAKTESNGLDDTQGDLSVGETEVPGPAENQMQAPGSGAPAGEVPEEERLEQIRAEQIYEDIANPGEKAAELVKEISDRIGLDTSKFVLMESWQTYRGIDFWLWHIAFDMEGAPVVRAEVRLDLGVVETYSPMADFFIKAVPDGGDTPSITVRALDLDSQGFEPAPWLSKPGQSVYKRRVPIGGYDVAVGAIIISYGRDNGQFLSLNHYELLPVEGFEMRYDEGAALGLIAQDLGREDLVPLNTDLVEVISGVSQVNDVEVYWEFTFDEGYIYVKCEDGTITFSNAGPSMPLGI